MIYSHNLFSCLCIDIVGENIDVGHLGRLKDYFFKTSALNWRRTKKKYRKNYQEAHMDQTEEYQHGLYSGKLEKQ